MAIVKCHQGHYFDNSKYDNCPHCNSGSELQLDQKTISITNLINEHLAPEVNSLDDEKTIGFYTRKIKADPVVGWLVCTDGPEVGRDYRIHAGWNYVGRAFKMDISIVDDDQISRDSHCSIVFDPASSSFLLIPGSGTSTYLNHELVTDPKPIKNGDIIKIGGSELTLIQFCGEGRKWDIKD